MADGKTIEIKDILKNDKYRFFTKIEPVDVTPTEWFIENKVPVKHRFSFSIVPMSADDLDMMQAYSEQSKYEVGFERTMSILGIGILDLWKFNTMAEFQAATPKEIEEKTDPELSLRIVTQQSEDFEAKLKSKKVFNTGRDKIILACTKSLFIGESKMDFTDKEFENLDKKLKDFLYSCILKESTLTKEEYTALR
jgi:hypothetical protein